jgi:DNA-binding transcriptional regulator YdaS (Cro superfamily)
VSQTDPGISSPTERLWRLLAHPIVAVEALEVVAGLTANEAAGLLGARVTTSELAASFLRKVPALLRSGSITTVTEAEMCYNEVRGPIQWSETLSARAASGSGALVFICTSIRRGYDTPSNRALKEALAMLRDSAEAVGPTTALALSPDLQSQIRRVRSQAVQYMHHRVLQDVSDKRMSGRDLRKVSASRRTSSASDSLELIRFATDPLPASAVARLVDDETESGHRLFLAVVAGLAVIGEDVLPVAVREGAVTAGPATYRHHRGHHPGVRVGRTRIVLSEDDITDRDELVAVLQGPEDLPRVLGEALQLA